MRRVYLDNNATTPLDPEVFEAMRPYFHEDCGNASSVHWYGQQAKAAIEDAAQRVLDARTAHPEASLADLYDPIAMPPDLRKAHQALDKAVDAAYGKKNFISDAERVAYLFELYHKYTSLLPAPEVQRKVRKKKIRGDTQHGEQ